jgi:hypothetical protein
MFNGVPQQLEESILRANIDNDGKFSLEIISNYRRLIAMVQKSARYGIVTCDSTTHADTSVNLYEDPCWRIAIDYFFNEATKHGWNMRVSTNQNTMLFEITSYGAPKAVPEQTCSSRFRFPPAFYIGDNLAITKVDLSDLPGDLDSRIVSATTHKGSIIPNFLEFSTEIISQYQMMEDLKDRTDRYGSRQEFYLTKNNRGNPFGTINGFLTLNPEMKIALESFRSSLPEGYRLELNADDDLVKVTLIKF